MPKCIRDDEVFSGNLCFMSHQHDFDSQEAIKDAASGGNGDRRQLQALMPYTFGMLYVLHEHSEVVPT